MSKQKEYNQHKTQKALQRADFIQAGGYDGRFKSKSVPSAKQYKRQQKHKHRAWESPV